MLLQIQNLIHPHMDQTSTFTILAANSQATRATPLAILSVTITKDTRAKVLWLIHRIQNLLRILSSHLMVNKKIDHNNKIKEKKKKTAYCDLKSSCVLVLVAPSQPEALS